MITESVIVGNRLLGSASRKIRERHTDHLGNIYYKTIVTDANITSGELDTLLSNHAQDLNNALAQQEIAEAITTYYGGGDPLHTEVSPNNWQKITPNYQTWFDLAKAVTIYFLQQSNKLELANISTIITRISSQDKASLWNVNVPTVSSINADIQTAFDTQTTLDLYTPRADSEGVVS